MLNAAIALPAGPGERDDHVFPLRERLRFRDNLGLALRDLRRRENFASLPRGPWQTFVAIATHWQANAEAWPSQEAIASFSGYSSRAVRDYVVVLEQRGVLRTRRERRPNGADRIYYAPGLVTLIELAAFIERFPRERAKHLQREPVVVVDPPAATSHLPEADSGAPPEEVSMEHRDQDHKPSSCEMAAAPSTVVEEEKVAVTQEDREVARAALAERMARKHPKRPAPRWFDASEIAFVALCASAIDGDREAKALAMSDAIAGAFLASDEGPPTVRFIWGTIDHFFDHVERGGKERRMRARLERSVADPPRTPAGAIAATAIPDEALAELDRIFGAGWRSNRVPR